MRAREKGTFAEEIGMLAGWPEHGSFLPSPKGAAFWRHLQPRPQVLTHHKLPLACHFKQKRMVAPLAKARGGTPTRDIPGPADMALRSRQIKYLNNKAELRLTGNVGLRSKITHSFKSAFTKEYLFSSPFLLKGRVVNQWCVLTLLNYKIFHLRLALKIHVYKVQ